MAEDIIEQESSSNTKLRGSFRHALRMILDIMNVPENTIYEMQSTKNDKLNIEEDETLMSKEIKIAIKKIVNITK